MGSKRFYEHAQNLLGGLKRKWALLNLGGKSDITIVNSIILLCYNGIILYYYIIILLYDIVLILLYYTFLYMLYYILKLYYIIALL